MAGVSRLQYTNEIRLIRVMCSGRIDLEFILRAFSNGQDGVFIGGCRLNECNYVTQGNYDALGNVLLVRKIMSLIGLNSERLNLVFMSASDGILFAEAINNFGNKVSELGRLGEGEGLDIEALKLKLEAVRKLVPYIRLVERERLRVAVKTKENYVDFYDSDQFTRIFDELIADKLALSQITKLLHEKPLSTSDIAGKLGLKPSDVSRHIINSSRQGLVRYDENLKSYALA